MFWPIVPILLTTAQPLSLSIWKLLFHAIVITKLLLSAICLPPTTFNKESHLSKQPILVTTTKYLATARALQHMDLESWVALNLIQFASQILMQVWCVCYLQHVASHLPESQLGDAICNFNVQIYDNYIINVNSWSQALLNSQLYFQLQNFYDQLSKYKQYS